MGEITFDIGPGDRIWIAGEGATGPGVGVWVAVGAGNGVCVCEGMVVGVVDEVGTASVGMALMIAAAVSATTVGK